MLRGAKQQARQQIENFEDSEEDVPQSARMGGRPLSAKPKGAVWIPGDRCELLLNLDVPRMTVDARASEPLVVRQRGAPRPGVNDTYAELDVS